MPRYKPPTITEKGLETHINKLTNNQYGLFVQLVEKGLNYTAIGKALDVHMVTARSWVKRYKEGKS